MKATLTLKKGEENKTLQIDNLMSIESMKMISQHLKDGWELVEGHSDNPVIDNYIKNQLTKYNANKEKYSVSIRETVKVATSIIKPQGKIKLSKRALFMSKFKKKEEE